MRLPGIFEHNVTYTFASDKPIMLLDGAHLLHLLERHGPKACAHKDGFRNGLGHEVRSAVMRALPIAPYARPNTYSRRANAILSELR